MRIAVVTTSYPTFEGDPAGHFVRNEVIELEREGHTVSVVKPRAGGAFGWPGAAARIAEQPHRLLEAGSWIARAALELRRIRPERVIAHWCVPCASPIALSAPQAASIEIVSHGNKHSRLKVDQFIQKATAALDDGYHLLVLDLFPPGKYDPQGMNSLVWEYINEVIWKPAPAHPFSMAAFCASDPWRAYMEPLQLGVPLIDMPLFLTREHYINVPLEATYMAAYRGVPARWRRVIEATS